MAQPHAFLRYGGAADARENAWCRPRARRKRGRACTGLDDVAVGAESAIVDVLALDEALTELNALDERLCRVVAALLRRPQHREQADALDVSSATVERDWTV